MSRYFLPKLAAALLAGGVLGILLPVTSLQAGVLFALFFLLALIAWWGEKFAHAVWLFGICGAAVLGLLLSRQSIELESLRSAQLYGPVHELKVRVLSDPYLETRAAAELLEAPNAGKQTTLYFEGGERPGFRDVIRVRGVAQGGRIRTSYWEPEAGSVPALSPVEQMYFYCLKIRDRIDRALREAHPPPGFLAFARAELFGKRGGLDLVTLRALQENGLSHIIAVSGLHTSLLAAVIFFLLSPQLGRESAAWVTVGSVGVFCVIAGMQPSVVRASICTALTLFGVCAKRPVRLGNILSAAFVTEFLIFPEHLRNVGFQLSYLAVLGIAVSDASIRSAFGHAERTRPVHPAIQWILPGLLIQVLTAPLSAHVFFRWSPVSILSNLIFLPIFTALIGLAAFGAAVAVMLPALASTLFQLGDLILSVTLTALGLLPRFLSLSSNFGELPLWALIAFVSAWFLFLCLIRRTPPALLAGAGMFLTALWLFPIARDAFFSPRMELRFGGSPAPYALVSEKSRLRYAWISGAPVFSPESFRPLIRECLRAGIRRVDWLDAPASVREVLAREFWMDDAEGPDGLSHHAGGFRFRKDGVDVEYRTASRHRAAEPAPADPRSVSWLILETSKFSAPVPSKVPADRAYISGGLGPDALRHLMARLDPSVARGIFASSVDGPLRIWQDRSGSWRYTTALQESFE
ncbi:ComEC/Rec2 family competence protein [bacterium]|nr:ComEC/Rec2 family competence protein [bacterium]